MSDTIFVVEECWGCCDDGKKCFTINRKDVERSFNLFGEESTEESTEEERDDFDREMIENGWNDDQRSAVLSSGTLGALPYDEELWTSNKEAFLSKKKGWTVEEEECNFAFGSTKEQALLAFALIEVDDEDEWEN